MTSYGACIARSITSPVTTEIMFPSVNGTHSRTDYLGSFSDVIMQDTEGKNQCIATHEVF